MGTSQHRFLFFPSDLSRTQQLAIHAACGNNSAEEKGSPSVGQSRYLGPLSSRNCTISIYNVTTANSVRFQPRV
jgi:hypothetical protein